MAMFESFKRSWELTKLSFSVINKDKELLAFPFLGSIFSIAFILLLLLPTLLTQFLSSATSSFTLDAFALMVLFFVYLGLAVIATFFDVCAVYTIKKRFEGGNASFIESIQFAVSKIHLVFYWGLLSATVGLILRLIESAGDKRGHGAQMISKIIASILGTAWAIASVFAIPAMVYHNHGPINALKSSVSAIKRTWGESLIRYYGLGAVESLLVMFGIIAGVILALVTGSWVFFIISTVIYVVIVSLIFSVANDVFNTALYAYANGKVPKGYSKDLLHNAFRKSI